jgi:hypothetical protein
MRTKGYEKVTQKEETEELWESRDRWGGLVAKRPK